MSVLVGRSASFTVISDRRLETSSVNLRSQTENFPGDLGSQIRKIGPGCQMRQCKGPSRIDSHDHGFKPREH